MILTKEVELKLNPKHFKYLKDLGYNDLKVGNIILVPIEHLQKRSNIKIKVKCDVCGKEKMLSYDQYNKSIKTQNYYSCSQKCSHEKMKITHLKKYGVKYILQNKDILNKFKQTMMKNYGVEHPTQNENIKEKIKKTNLKRHGTKYPLLNEDIKEKARQTMIRIHGTEYAQQNKEIHKKQQRSGFLLKKHKDTNLHYQGTYEEHFLNFCFENDITVINGPSVNYLFENKNKVYHSDFYSKKHNLIVEIKSDYIYNKESEKNLAKQKSCIQQGYNFLFIINKEYGEFLELYT